MAGIASRQAVYGGLFPIGGSCNFANLINKENYYGKDLRSTESHDVCPLGQDGETVHPHW